MDGFINGVKKLSQFCGFIAAALVGLAILVVCQMVVMRYILNASTVWQTEFVTFALVAATFIGSPYVLLLRGHVNVDLLPLYLGQKGRFVLALLACFGGLSFCALLTWAGYELTYEAWEGGWRTDSVWALQLWIPYIAMPIGIGLLCLQYVADILSLVTGREMPFAMDHHSKYEGE